MTAAVAARSPGLGSRALNGALDSGLGDGGGGDRHNNQALLHGALDLGLGDGGDGDRHNNHALACISSAGGESVWRPLRALQLSIALASLAIVACVRQFAWGALAAWNAPADVRNILIYLAAKPAIHRFPSIYRRVSAKLQSSLGYDFIHESVCSINRLRVLLPWLTALTVAAALAGAEQPAVDQAVMTPPNVSFSAAQLDLPYAPRDFAGTTSTVEHVALVNSSVPTPTWRSSEAIGAFLAAVDSGCTASATTDARRVTNKRPCNEVFGDANGRVVKCTAIGDMPVLATDPTGATVRFSFTNVRVVPSFKYTLLSVKQMWREQGINARFAGDMHLQLPPSANNITIPFGKDHPLCVVELVSEPIHMEGAPAAAARLAASIHRHVASPTAGSTSSSGAAATVASAASIAADAAVTTSPSTPVPSPALLGYHSVKSTSHVAKLSSAQAGELFHRRTHAGLSRMRAAPNNTSDAPNNLRSAPQQSCIHCAQSNIKKASHSGTLHTPHPTPGKLHFDLKGPMARSIGGAYYAGFWIDEHTRMVFFEALKSKDEVVPAFKRVIAKFNATVGVETDELGVPKPRPQVYEIRSDHEGALTSYYFEAFRSEESIHSSMSPPHDHDLNPIAEATIRVIDRLAAAMRALCGAPLGLWPYLFRHAVDVHNATCTATGSAVSDGQLTAEQRFTLRQPSIMDLCTFGCSAVVLKPQPHIRKGDLSSRGWVGNFLGRSSVSVGGYDAWVPALGTVVTSASVIIDEEHLPWLGKEAYQPLRATSHTGPQHRPTVLGPPAPVAGGPPTLASASDINAAPSKALHMLNISSSPRTRPFDFAQRLIAFGWSSVRQASSCVRQPNSTEAASGDWGACLANDSVYTDLAAAARNGEFEGVMISADGEPVVAERALEIANLARRSKSAATIVIAYRGDSVGAARRSCALTSPAFHRLRAAAGPNSSCTFAMCRFGLQAQEYTSLWYSNDAASALNGLSSADYQCNHQEGAHPRRMGETANSSASAEPATTADRFLVKLAAAFNTARTGSPQPFAPPRARPPLTVVPAPPATRLLNPHATVWSVADPPPPALASPPPSRDVTPAASPARSAPPSRAAVSPVRFSGFDSADGSNTSSYVPYDPDARLGVQGRAERTVRQSTRDSRSDTSAPVESDRVAGRELETLSEAEALLSNELLSYSSASRSEHMEAAAAELVFEAHVELRPEHTALGPWADVDATAWALCSSSSSATRVANDTIVVDALEAAKSLAKQACLLALSTSQSLPRDAYALLFEELKSVELALRADSSGAPSTHAEASEWGTPWPEAMGNEMGNHAANETWIKIRRDQLPRGRRLHKLVWVFKLKRDGTAKARLCVQGCTLQSGIDYDQTFSQALRHSSARAIFAFAARKGLGVHSIDYVAAYLQGRFTEGEVVYCHMPPGQEELDADGNRFVLRIEKPIYGILQAGRRLQRQIFPRLKGVGLRQLVDSDGCVWVYDDPAGHESFVLGVYVDNLQIAHSAELDVDGWPTDASTFYAKFLSKLVAEWDVGPMEDLLAIQLRVNNDGSYTLHQEAYVLKLLAKYAPNGPPAHVQRNSLPYSNDLNENIIKALSVDGASAKEPAYPHLVRPYQERIGSLMYLSTAARCDITYPVHQLARAMSQPTPELMIEIDHVLAYLARNVHVGLTFEAGRAKPFEGFSDASWETRFSTSGWVIRFQGCAVNWGSIKQNCVALSSCESEIIALSEAAKDMIYFRKLFKGIDSELVHGPSDLSSDNMAARDLAYNPEHHARTKHVERRHFYIRDMVEKFELNVPYVSTDENLADFLTKALPSKRFFYLRRRIMNEPGLR